ncbi:MAG: glycogen/starch/alpha-glucan family phosphorylase [Clostridiales bacterium]|nr:glycogen/starch/alpha-glucan family phosphorylase [Clostridiales bacterium]
MENKKKREAYYFSIEFLIGRLFKVNGYEDLEDGALGSGGLGRLAACFLDSAANLGLLLHGRGIRYKYGLFKQAVKDGFQVELPDIWQDKSGGDPWGARREDEKREVKFADFTATAVPYDYPIIGENGHANVLRFWQAEGSAEAEKISEYLYPDDSADAGKILRIRQEYFFSAASVGELIEGHIKRGGKTTDFPAAHTVQLNDTHPVFALAEFVRLLTARYGVVFADAVNLARQTFNYTNHTIMAEALERWDAKLVKRILPEIHSVMKKIDAYAKKEFRRKGCLGGDVKAMEIYGGKQFRMANLAVFIGASVNGVAKLHTEILKAETLKEAYKYYPDKFNNKTNGITHRRWLTHCNGELSAWIDKKVGTAWRGDITQIKALEEHADAAALEQLLAVKRQKKAQLAAYIKEKEGAEINPDSVFYIQVKRLHEYKCQFMAALGILAIYDGIKDGSIRDFTPSAFIFGAKAVAGYKRAKATIKFINEIARLVGSDPQTKGLLRVVFVQNYNVSYAERLMPAADISLQISAAGLEASGTGNMKFMLNGAVTLGTMDGANIEIVALAGKENNCIFGAGADDIRRIEKTYDPNKILRDDARIQKAVSYLTNGKLDDGGTGYFKELHTSLTEKTYNAADRYFVLYDLPAFVEAALKVNGDYKDRLGFARKLLVNIANAAYFSSDRTVREYAADIWRI